jgi:DNA-binding CsgD family transcriptional regulator
VEFAPRDLLVLDVLRPWLMRYEEQRWLARLVGKLTIASIDSAVVAAGLSLRENEVLDLVAEGASNAAIAERLWISPATAAKHLENIYLKLDVGSRTAALARTGRSFRTAHPPD